MNSGIFGTAKPSADLLGSPQGANTVLAGPVDGNPDLPDFRTLRPSDEASVVNRFFGDGSDGDFTLTTTSFSGGPFTSGGLVRSASINNLTLSGNGRISAGGWLCLIRGVLDVRTVNSTGGLIGVGNNGFAGSGSTGGASSSASGGNIIGGGIGSTVGANGTTTTGGNATAQSTSRLGHTRLSGAGGAGGTGSSGAGGTGSTSVNQYASIVGNGPNYRVPMQFGFTLLNTTLPSMSAVFGGICGGSGGSGGGDGTNSGRGGGSGSESGRNLTLAARTIWRSAATAASCFRAWAGAAGAGAAGTGNTGGGGGGGGGSGGIIYLMYENLIGSTCVGALDVSGGAGGNGGNGAGTGFGGQGGQGGQAGVVYLANVFTGIVQYIPATGGTITVPSVPGNSTGSSGTAGETFRVDL